MRASMAYWILCALYLLLIAFNLWTALHLPPQSHPDTVAFIYTLLIAWCLRGCWYAARNGMRAHREGL